MEVMCNLQPPAVNILNSSFSSDVASIPSQNLGEISTFSDISDSELDTREETPLGKNESQRKFSHGVNGNEIISSTEVTYKTAACNKMNTYSLNHNQKNAIQNPNELLQNKYSDDKASSVQSLNDIKSTLQENGNLVNDRKLLDDIMKSIDNTIICTNNKQDMKSDITTLPSAILLKNKDSETVNSSSIQNIQAVANGHPKLMDERKQKNKIIDRCEDPIKQCVSEDINKNKNRSNNNAPINNVFGYASLGSGMNTHLVEKHANVTENMSYHMKTIDRDVSKSFNQEKHVTFVNDSLETSYNNRQGEERSEEINNEGNVQLQQKLLSHLSKIRWQLGGWEDIQRLPPDGERESEAFMNKVMQLLQEQNLKKKHLEEELYASRSSMAKASEELYVLRRLKESRNIRLKEADAQLKILHSEWTRSQKESKSNIIKLNKNCAHLKEVKKQLESQIEDLKHQNANLMVLKAENNRMNLTLEEMRMQLTESQRQSAEVLEENERLNTKLEEFVPKFKHMEEVEMPRITQDNRILKDKCLSFEEEVKTSTLAKLHLEGDLELLKKQHNSLLQKVIQQEQQKQAVTIECDNFKKQYVDIKQNVHSSKEEIRCHYQKQMENLMAKKSENFQKQLNDQVTGLKENLLAQLNTQRDAHNHQIEIMRKEQKEETERLNHYWQRHITQLERELNNVKHMNENLIAQRKGFIVAVTAILGPSETQNLVGNLTNHHSNRLSSFSFNRHINHEVSKKPSEIGKTSQDDPSTLLRSNTIERVVKRRSVHSRNNSRPNSGTTKEAMRLPLIVGNDTSSESDASDGRTTVRHAASGQNRNVNSNLGSNVEPKNSSNPSGNRNTYGSRNVVNNTNKEKFDMNTMSHKDKLNVNFEGAAEHFPMQYIADINVKRKNVNYYEQGIQRSNLVIDSNAKNILQPEINSENIHTPVNSDRDQKHISRDNDIGVNQGNRADSNYVNQISIESQLFAKQKRQVNEKLPNTIINNNQVSYLSENFPNKINLASDILEANDTLDSDESEIQKKHISKVDEEMARLVEELK
ncbi:unnamed protein product, partial [Meganyctiphanes norvegica]